MNIGRQHIALRYLLCLVAIIALPALVVGICPERLCNQYDACNKAEESCVGRIIKRALEQNKCALVTDLLVVRSAAEQQVLWPCVLASRRCASTILRSAWTKADATEQSTIIAGLCVSNPDDVTSVLGDLACACFPIAKEIVVTMSGYPGCSLSSTAFAALMGSCPSATDLCAILATIHDANEALFNTLLCDVLKQLVCQPTIGQRGAVELFTRLFDDSSDYCFASIGCATLSALAQCDVPHKADMIGQIISAVADPHRAAQLLCCLIYNNYLRGVYGLSDLTVTICGLLSGCRQDHCSIILQALGVNLNGSLCQALPSYLSTECSAELDPIDWAPALAQMTDELAACLCEFASHGPQGIESAAIILCKIITCNNDKEPGLGTSQATQIIIRMITTFGPQCGYEVLEQLKAQFYGLPCGDLYTDLIKIEILISCKLCAPYPIINPCDEIFNGLDCYTIGDLCALIQRALSTRCAGENALISWITDLLTNQRDTAFCVIQRLCSECPQYMCLVARAFTLIPREDLQGIVHDFIEQFVVTGPYVSNADCSCVAVIIAQLVAKEQTTPVLNALIGFLQEQDSDRVANLLCCLATSDLVSCCGLHGEKAFEELVAGIAQYGVFCCPSKAPAAITRATYGALLAKLCQCPSSAALIARAFGLLDKTVFSQEFVVRREIKNILVDIMRLLVAQDPCYPSSLPYPSCCSWLRTLLEEFSLVIYDNKVDMSIVDCLCEDQDALTLKYIIDHLVDGTLPLKGHTSVLVKDGNEYTKYNLSVGFKKCGKKIFLTLDPAMYLNNGLMASLSGPPLCAPCRPDNCPRISINPGVLSTKVLSGNLRKCLLRDNPHVADKKSGLASIEDCLAALGEAKAWRLFEELKKKFE